jgi:DnaK suppressor protein
MKTRATNAPPAPVRRSDRTVALLAMLHERQREVEAVVRRRSHLLPAEAPNNGLDDFEHAEAEIQQHLATALLQMRDDAVQRIREALARAEAGDYGYCGDCGAEISEPRLRALPFAVRCTACETAHERQSAAPAASQLFVTGPTGT